MLVIITSYRVRVPPAKTLLHLPAQAGGPASKGVDAQAVAWQSGDVTLVRVVPSANGEWTSKSQCIAHGKHKNKKKKNCIYSCTRALYES